MMCRETPKETLKVFQNLLRKIPKWNQDIIDGEYDRIVKQSNIGFCEFFWFKCAGARTCDAWVGGGPIT